MTEKDRDSRYYIAMISFHGLVRGHDIELGRDADTGGQVSYVVELARTLSNHPNVERVDLFTRQIFDRRIDDEYAEPYEKLDERAYLVRIPCGPKRYLRKEVLWPHIGEFADNMLHHFRKIGKVPDIIHGHYADAGLIGSQLSSVLGVPFVFTGHSMGYSKLERLQEKGMDRETIERKYNISQRIEAEEIALDTAQLVVTSTEQERGEQYEAYANRKKNITVVIPPGVGLDRFTPGKRGQPLPRIYGELSRFLQYPKKPIVLALSRADERKNIGTLIDAFGKNEKLRGAANLVLVLGNRDDIDDLDTGAKKVLTNALKRIDKHDLYGRVAIPKHHDSEDVPELYRLAAQFKGVFVNPALTEPFGLTIIEAAASGLPVVATHDGGPSEILRKCKNGVLIDPLDEKRMGEEILAALQDKNKWARWSRNGVRNARRYYSWEGHAEAYMKEVAKINKRWKRKTFPHLQRSRLLLVQRLLISDIDGTLLGDRDALPPLFDSINAGAQPIAFAIATGRHLGSASEVLQEWGVPLPDIWITSVGTEIYYGPNAVQDQVWRQHINYRWAPNRIREVMSGIDGLVLQSDDQQREHKVSYDVSDPDKAPTRRQLMRYLRERKLAVQVIYSHGKHVDLLPLRASKGQAVRYLAMKWGLDLKNILVAGDSGNDEDMLKVNALGVVVGNYSRELRKLKGHPRIYFASDHFAWGVAEGARHFRFFDLNQEYNDNGRSETQYEETAYVE